MPRLTWGNSGKRFYEAGVDRGVLYVGSQAGVPWNGLVSVSENPEGGESRSYYFDGIKYQVISAAEEFSATIEAFTYPDEFAVCDGTATPHPGFYITHQRRVPFGFSYRTRVGNDLDGPEHGYKIHLVYNALAEPSDHVSNTLGSSIDPDNFSWRITTKAPVIDGFARTAHFVIDSRTASPSAFSEIEDILYGTDAENSRLPTISELFEIFLVNAIFVITDHGDGSWTATGPDILIKMIDETSFEINSVTAFYVDGESYTISSSSD